MSLRTGASRGVALVNALVVVAALAAISAALLIRADRALERQSLRGEVDQAGSYLAAGQAQALSELRAIVEEIRDGAIRPGQGWDRPRSVPIHRGSVGWTFDDLQGRFNLTWLADEGVWGEIARDAFLRLVEGQGIAPALAERLARAAGSDSTARAAAFGTARAPDLPLILPRQLAVVPRADEGGGAALAPLWPLLAALPAGATLNPNTAPVAVLQAFVTGLDPEDWSEFEAARLSGLIDGPGGLLNHAAANWPESTLAMLSLIPMDGGSDWFELRLAARLDSVTLRRSAVVALTDPDNPARLDPRVVVALPIVE